MPALAIVSHMAAFIMATIMAQVMTALMTIMVAVIVTVVVTVIAVMAVLRPVWMTIHIWTTVDVIHPSWPIIDGMGDDISRWTNHHRAAGMSILRRSNHQLRR